MKKLVFNNDEIIEDKPQIVGDVIKFEMLNFPSLDNCSSEVGKDSGFNP